MFLQWNTLFALSVIFLKDYNWFMSIQIQFCHHKWVKKNFFFQFLELPEFSEL